MGDQLAVLRMQAFRDRVDQLRQRMQEGRQRLRCLPIFLQHLNERVVTMRGQIPFRCSDDGDAVVLQQFQNESVAVEVGTMQNIFAPKGSLDGRCSGVRIKPLQHFVTFHFGLFTELLPLCLVQVDAVILNVSNGANTLKFDLSNFGQPVLILSEPY